MTMLKLFKSAVPSCKTHLPNGKEINFVGGRYATDDPLEIEYLEGEIKARHPIFYVDSKELEVDSVRVDPVEAIRRKAIADYLAEQEAKVGTNTGDTKAPQKVVTSADALASVKSNLKS